MGIKNQINRKVKIKYKKHWLKHITKFREIMSSIFRSNNQNISRKQTSIINRLRVEYTRLTHAYLIIQTELPMCETCEEELTVKYILT